MGRPHAREAGAVMRPGAVSAQRFDVERRRVALVLGETVSRVFAVEFHQQGVAIHLGQNRRRGHDRAARVAVNDRLLRTAVRPDPHGVGDQVFGRRRQRGDGAFHREHAGPIDIEPVDFGDACDADPPGKCARLDLRFHLDANLGSHLLRIVESPDEEWFPRNHASGNDRAGQRPAADFVDAADKGEAALAGGVFELVQPVQPAPLAFVGVLFLAVVYSSCGDSNEKRPNVPSLSARMYDCAAL